MQRVTAIYCLIFLAGVLSSCGSISTSSKQIVYTLYLEDVQVPDEIHANEDFTICLVYSASLNPGIFADNGLYWGVGPLNAVHQGDAVMVMYFLHDDPSYQFGAKDSGKPNVFSLELMYTEPGTRVFYFGTVSDRSQGGNSRQLSLTPGVSFTSGEGGYSHREVVINVLP
ncbi:hypothetical protein JW859_08165 [bacterium]|nr:hypothetical protein [bacterium]